MERKLTALELERRQKLAKLNQMGINPYSSSIAYQDNSHLLQEKYAKFSREDLINQEQITSVVGRITALRIPFIDLKDSEGKIQLYLDKNNQQLTPFIKLLDIGDIVWVEGLVIKTKTGALAIKAQKIVFLSKSLKPLPEKWHGLKDIEERFRHRYVDLIVNEEVKKVFWTRTKIIKYIREYFDNLGYMEVETPILNSILGGAAARPFTTHHNTLKRDFYLRIATELPLKKLLVGGIDRVYEIGRIFRNEGIDPTHNPEFTSIEFYEAYSDLEGMIKRTEEVIRFVAQKLHLSELNYQGQTIDLSKPFKRIDMVAEVSRLAKHDFMTINLKQAQDVARKYHIKVEPYFTIGHIINELFAVLVEPHLVEPTFVTNYPIEISPLAAKNPQDPRFTDRAELFIGKREYANMFTELNDPIDQLARFQQQLSEKEQGNDEANEIDDDFIEALEYGMPPAGGCGIGIDRLVMLFTNQDSIREVLFFPHLRDKGVKND